MTIRALDGAGSTALHVILPLGQEARQQDVLEGQDVHQLRQDADVGIVGAPGACRQAETLLLPLKNAGDRGTNVGRVLSSPPPPTPPPHTHTPRPLFFYCVFVLLVFLFRFVVLEIFIFLLI